MCSAVNNTYYLGLSCCNKLFIVEHFTYRWKHKLNYFILTDESKGSAIMCVCVGCMFIFSFSVYYYCVCPLLLFVLFFCIYVFFVYIIYIFLDKGLILLFYIFLCNSCPFLSRLFCCLPVVHMFSYYCKYTWCLVAIPSSHIIQL